MILQLTCRLDCLFLGGKISLWGHLRVQGLCVGDEGGERGRNEERRCRRRGRRCGRRQRRRFVRELKWGRHERRRTWRRRNRERDGRFRFRSLVDLSEVVVDEVGVDEALEVLLRLLLLQVDDGDFAIRNRFRLLRTGRRRRRISVRNVGERDQVVLLVVFVLMSQE